MKFKTLITLIILVPLLFTAKHSAATLILQNAGDEVLDTETGLIWMQDWGLSTSAYGSTQVQWANDLSYAGNTEWRLPTISESINMLALYGNAANLTEFTNVATNRYYWTRGNRGYNQWQIKATGERHFVDMRRGNLGVSVRTATASDMAFSVPEPSTLAIFALGMMGLVTRRFKEKH